MVVAAISETSRTNTPGTGSNPVGPDANTWSRTAVVSPGSGAISWTVTNGLSKSLWSTPEVMIFIFAWTPRELAVTTLWVKFTPNTIWAVYWLEARPVESVIDCVSDMAP